MSDLGKSLPIWVSRKNADGMISTFEVPLWLFMLIGVLALLNVVGWGMYGLYALALTVL